LELSQIKYIKSEKKYLLVHQNYPFTESSEIIDIEFYSGPYRLSGELILPRSGKIPYPVTLIVADSPRHNRNGYANGYPAFEHYYSKISDVILSTGSAVFRYDKGGSGKSSSGLNDKIDMVSAYKSMCSKKEIDPGRVTILAQGGGSAFVFRNIKELNRINPLHSLVLLSTSVNDLKLEKLTCNLCVIVGEGEAKKSPSSLERYEKLMQFKTNFREIKGVDEKFCLQVPEKSWYKTNGCTLSIDLLTEINDWYKIIK
jgi:hypothetical protein